MSRIAAVLSFAAFASLAFSQPTSNNQALFGAIGSSFVSGKSQKIPIPMASTAGDKAVKEAIDSLTKAREQMEPADKARVDPAIKALNIILSRTAEPTTEFVTTSLVGKNAKEVIEILGTPVGMGVFQKSPVWGYNYAVAEANSTFLAFDPKTAKVVNVLFDKGQIKGKK